MILFVRREVFCPMVYIVSVDKYSRSNKKLLWFPRRVNTSEKVLGLEKIHEYIPQNLTYLHQMEVFYHPRENIV